MLGFKSLLIICVGLVSASSQAAVSTLPPEVMVRVRTSKSQLVLVQVWSPFCEPCGKEVSEINKALKSSNAPAQCMSAQPILDGCSLSKTNPVLSAFGVPVGSRKREIDAFISHFRPEYEQLVEISRTIKRGDAYHLPWSILFTREGAVLREWVGTVSSDEILGAVKAKQQGGTYL